MKVICAGIMKTGTCSLARALEVLGYKVYDFPSEDFEFQEWLDSFQTDRLPNFNEVFKGFDAVTDHPAAFWFEEISNAFPEARVILTVRDSEEVWLKSWQEHLQIKHRFLPFHMKVLLEIAPSWRKKRRYFDIMHNAICGSDSPEAAALYRTKYRQHNTRVQAVIPPEKLLVYNVKHGWKPLCEFLGCEVPSIQFPHANVGHSDTKNRMTGQLEEAKRETTVVFIFVFAMLSLLAAFFHFFITG